MVKKYKQKTFLYIQMVVMTDCESLNIKDNMIFRFFLHLKKNLWYFHVYGSQEDTGRRVMLQNLSLHAKIGISKRSFQQVQNIRKDLSFLIHLLDLPKKRSLLLNYSIKSVVGKVLWQSLISLFWSHMTKMAIQAKNQIKVVRLNIQIYHMK